MVRSGSMRWLIAAVLVVGAVLLQAVWLWWQADVDVGAVPISSPEIEPPASSPSETTASPLQAGHADCLALAEELAATTATLDDGRRRFTIERDDWRGWLVFDDGVLQQASLHVPRASFGAIADEKQFYHLLRSLAQSTGAEPAAAAVMAKGTVAALRSGRPMKDIAQGGFERSSDADGLQISVTGAPIGVVY